MHFLDFVFNIVSLFIWHNDNYLQLHTKENQHLANFLHLNFRYFMVQYLKKSMKYNTTTEYYNLSTCSYRLSHIPCPNSPVTFSIADLLPSTFQQLIGCRWHFNSWSVAIDVSTADRLPLTFNSWSVAIDVSKADRLPLTFKQLIGCHW